MRKPGAGDFHNRVVIEQDTITTAASGAKTHTWTTLATVWASIEPGISREINQARQIAAEATALIKLRRYLAGITAGTTRVKYVDPKDSRTRYFDVKGTMNPGEWRDQLWLVAQETNQ